MKLGSRQLQTIDKVHIFNCDSGKPLPVRRTYQWLRYIVHQFQISNVDLF